MKSKSARLLIIILSLAAFVITGVYYAARVSFRAWNLSSIVGVDVGKSSIVAFADRSTKDLDAAWLVKCDAKFIDAIMKNSHAGYLDQAGFATSEATHLFGISAESLSNEIFIRDFKRYEVWVLFNREKTMAFVMAF